MAASEFDSERKWRKLKGKKRGFWFRFKMKRNENTKLVRHVPCLRFQNRSRDVVDFKCSVANRKKKTKKMNIEKINK